MSNPIYNYIDEHGFPFHMDLDKQLPNFGDSTQRWGMLKIAQWLSGDISHDTERQLDSIQFELSKEYVRHPTDPGWSQAGVMSRDNMQPVVQVMALYGFTDKLKEHLWTITKRAGFLWNVKDLELKRKKFPIPDWTGPVYLGQILRGLSMWFYPVVMVLDVFVVLQSLARVVSSVFSPKHTSDDLNFQCVLVLGQAIKPTPFIYLAKLIYWLRLQPYDPWKDDGSRIDNNQPAALNAIMSYFRVRDDEEPFPMMLVWGPVVEKWVID